MNELLVMTVIAGRKVAFRAVEVQSVIDMGPVTPIPLTAPHIVGLTAQRSRALTVFDCRMALGYEPADFDTDGRAAIVSSEGHAYALLVDRVDDIVEAASEPTPVTGGFGQGWAAIAVGMVETATGPAVLIDIDRLIAGQSREAA